MGVAHEKAKSMFHRGYCQKGCDTFVECVTVAVVTR